MPNKYQVTLDSAQKQIPDITASIMTLAGQGIHVLGSTVDCSVVFAEKSEIYIPGVVALRNITKYPLTKTSYSGNEFPSALIVAEALMSVNEPDEKGRRNGDRPQWRTLVAASYSGKGQSRQPVGQRNVLSQQPAPRRRSNPGNFVPQKELNAQNNDKVNGLLESGVLDGSLVAAWSYGYVPAMTGTGHKFYIGAIGQAMNEQGTSFDPQATVLKGIEERAKAASGGMDESGEAEGETSAPQQEPEVKTTGRTRRTSQEQPVTAEV